MSSSSSACNIAAKGHSVNWRECWNCARHVSEAWRALRRGSCGDGRSCHGTPLTLPVGWSGPAGFLCCWSNKEPSAHMAMTNCGVEHSHTSTNSVHTSLQTHTCALCHSTYLHIWQSRCCWRLFCTGPGQELCAAGGRCADPTEAPAQDQFTHSFRSLKSALNVITLHFKSSPQSNTYGTGWYNIKSIFLQQ